MAKVKATTEIETTTDTERSNVDESAEISGAEETVADQEYFDVDQLAETYQTDAAVLAGMKVMNHWGKGKKVTKTEYEKAISAFLNGTC